MAISPEDRAKLQSQNLEGAPQTKKDLDSWFGGEAYTEKTPGAFVSDQSYPVVEENIPNTQQMLHDMKVKERELEQSRNLGLGEPGEVITSADMKLSSGVYSGAGGYEYEVMPGGEIKILQAPGGRGVGVTLKHGHPAHEAIFDELSEGGESPLDSNYEAEYEALTSMAGASSQREADAQAATGVRPGEGRSGDELARVQGMALG